MSRRQRQLDEVRERCASGSLGHALDLAFLHFADFGRDDELLDLLAGEVRRPGVAEGVRRRFDDLCCANQGDPR